MERITINKVEYSKTKAGKDMWKVTYDTDKTFNLFEKDNAEACYFNDNIGKVCEVSFVPSKCGKYKNFESVNKSGSFMPTTNPSHEAREGCPADKPKSFNEMRDKSIIAQCMIKGAVELAKGKDFANNEALGEYLCMATVELCGAYKLALNQL
jgi:hypothetical protein